MAVVCLCAALNGCGAKKEAPQGETPAQCDYLVPVNKKNRLPENWEATVVLEDAQNTLPEDVKLNEDNAYVAADVFRVEKKTLEEADSVSVTVENGLLRRTGTPRCSTTRFSPTARTTMIAASGIDGRYENAAALRKRKAAVFSGGSGEIREKPFLRGAPRGCSVYENSCPGSTSFCLGGNERSNASASFSSAR